jgi:hypothetical protein
VGLQRYQEEARAKLGHAIVNRLQHLPFRLVPKFRELGEKASAITREFFRCKPWDILKEDGSGFHLPHQGDGCGEHVPLIVRSELLAGNAKWGAGHACRKEVNI